MGLNEFNQNIIICTINLQILTNPLLVRTASIMPALKVAQLRDPLSLGTLMNLFT